MDQARISAAGHWGLICLFAFAWLPALFGASVYDDVINIDRNVAVRELDLPQLLSRPFFREHLGYWRPLSQLLLALTSQAGFVAIHAAAILLHGAAALAFIRIVRHRLGWSSTDAAWAGCLFAIHPIHAESIAWASALPEVLAGTLSLMALYHAMAGSRKGALIASGLLLSALLSKETSVALVPVIVMAPAFTPQRQDGAYRRCLLLAASALGTWLALRHFVLADGMPSISGKLRFSHHLLGSAEVFWREIRLLLAAWPLTPFRTGPGVPTEGSIGWANLTNVAVSCSVLLAALITWLRVRRLRLAVCMILCPALLPAITWPSLGEFCIQDRYMYPAACGLAAFVVSACSRRGWVLVSTSCALSIIAHTQNGIWRDQKSLVQHGLVAAPHLATIQIMAGDECLAVAVPSSDAVQQASRYYNAALGSLFPRDTDLRRERRAAAFIGLGWCEFQKATTTFPQDAERVALLFRKGLEEHADAVAGWVGLGSTHARAGAHALAEREFRRALAIDPDRPEAWYNLGVLKVDLGAYAEARASFAEALRCNPRLDIARHMLDSLRDR